MKLALPWVAITLVKAMATTLIFAVLFYFISGRPDSVWGIALGFGAGTLIFDLTKAVLDRRQGRAGRT